MSVIRESWRWPRCCCECDDEVTGIDRHACSPRALAVDSVLVDLPVRDCVNIVFRGTMQRPRSATSC